MQHNIATLFIFASDLMRQSQFFCSGGTFCKCLFSDFAVLNLIIIYTNLKTKLDYMKYFKERKNYDFLSM